MLGQSNSTTLTTHSYLNMTSTNRISDWPTETLLRTLTLDPARRPMNAPFKRNHKVNNQAEDEMLRMGMAHALQTHDNAPSFGHICRDKILHPLKLQSQCDDKVELDSTSCVLRSRFLTKFSWRQELSALIPEDSTSLSRAIAPPVWPARCFSYSAIYSAFLAFSAPFRPTRHAMMTARSGTEVLGHRATSVTQAEDPGDLGTLSTMLLCTDKTA
ncbi:hypothetical protein BDZ45DRAFT_724585 [Acephala macrosclerotiorum]|nr:hypothetical protein BDZ45DRAFT_724585 [Acephala macrosclerotiorum]